MPEAEVVSLLELALQRARDGRIKAIAIVAVNPVQEVEVATEGDMCPLRANAILGGLSQATSKILKSL